MAKQHHSVFGKSNVPVAREAITKHWDFAVPLHLRLRPSWRLAGALLIMHTGAAICLLTTALSGWMTWLAMLAIACHLLYALGQHAFRCTSTAITEFTVADTTQIKLMTGSGQPIEAVLLGGYSHPLLKVLRLRLGPWHRRALVLLPDMVEADRLRELRVRLRRLGPSTDADSV